MGLAGSGVGRDLMCPCIGLTRVSSAAPTALLLSLFLATGTTSILLQVVDGWLAGRELLLLLLLLLATIMLAATMGPASVEVKYWLLLATIMMAPTMGPAATEV
jgi:hypothetical protein